VFAMSAMAASSASATDVFTSVNSHETSSGVGHGVYTLRINPGLAFECTTMKFHTTKTGNGPLRSKLTPEGTINVTPHTKHCSTGLGTADINMNGCEPVFTGTTVSGHAKVWIECEASKEIELKATEAGITLKIPSQTSTSGGVTYTNE